jgi:hypothetical protein
MIYFGYPLDIPGWKTKTEPDTKPETEPENCGWKTIPKPEPVGPETRGYPTRTRSAAILLDPWTDSFVDEKEWICSCTEPADV